MKNRVTGMLFVLAMASMANASAQKSGIETTVQKNQSDAQSKVLQKVKNCIGVEDLRVIQTQSFELMQAWAKLESRAKRRVTVSHGRTTMNQVKETDGVFWAMSLPDNKIDKKAPKNMQSKKYLDYVKMQIALFERIESCGEAENFRMIESKDKGIVERWAAEEMKDDKRLISTHLDSKTGVYTATSLSKRSPVNRTVNSKMDTLRVRQIQEKLSGEMRKMERDTLQRDRLKQVHREFNAEKRISQEDTLRMQKLQEKTEAFAAEMQNYRANKDSLNTKNLDGIWKWFESKVQENKRITLSISDETGVYTAIAAPLPEDERTDPIYILQSRLSTKSVKTLKAWIEEEIRGCYILISFDKEHSTYTATSRLKTEEEYESPFKK
jgi:hypothetical protein